MGEKNQVNYGILLQGRFEGCLLCNKCQFGLWSCNIGVKHKEDKKALFHVTGDLDKNLIPLETDDRYSLVARIS